MKRQVPAMMKYFSLRTREYDEAEEEAGDDGGE